MWTSTFWKALSERAISTAAQAAVAFAFVGSQTNALDVDWESTLGVAAGGALLAVLKGLAANAITGDGPSLTHAETTTSTTVPGPLAP